MKPSSVILDLLRTYPPQKGTGVKTIMATGAMFGFNENLMRVNLSRLVSKGVVENFRRGHYRLTNHTDPLNDFVESWRLGEARIRDWDGHSWLLLHHDIAPSDKRDWALDAMGFRPISESLWLRPDNLALVQGELEQRLIVLGVENTCLLAGGCNVARRWQEAFEAHFDFPAMAARYAHHLESLKVSLARLESMPIEKALKESFLLGGEVVHLLAKDPLLPAEYIDTTTRESLWRTMLDYDTKGREIWGKRGREQPNTMPIDGKMTS